VNYSAVQKNNVQPQVVVGHYRVLQQ